MDRRILSESIDCVRANDLSGLREIYRNIPKYVNREYLFTQVFLSSCTHQKPEIIYWLYMIYLSMDPVAQVALKHVFTYGKYIIKSGGLRNWYEKSILVS